MRATKLIRQQGNALVEAIVSLVTLTPFLIGMVLLGKQLDMKHKSYDALRYSVWERTIWRGGGANAKTDSDITLEVLDRSLGHPQAGLSSLASLREAGVSRNPLWRDHQGQWMLEGGAGAALSTYSDDTPAAEVGYMLIPALAHGEAPVAAAARALRLDDLNLNRRSFAGATVSVRVKPVLAQFADHSATAHSPLIQQARGALLSDTWSSRDEGEFRRRVDDVTANELIETLEMPGRPIAMQALRKGGPLYGEGQYGWDPDLRPRSSALPAAYVTDRNHE